MSATTQSMRTRRYGRGAINTRANAITIGRLLFAVPTLALIVRDGPGWLTVALWFVLSCSDGLDGWLARRDGTTSSGAFLDPLADKILVLGGFGALLSLGDVWWLPVALIAAREIGISVYRAFAGQKGVSIPARSLGKLKTFFQLLTVGSVLLPWTASLHGVQLTVLWIAVALTIVSGVELLRRGAAARP